MLTTARLRAPAPLVSRALKGRLGSWRALRGRDIGASFRTRVGPSRRFSARIGRATGRRRDEPAETRAPRVPCLKRPARLMARPERARYRGVLQDARGAEPALQRPGRTTAGRPPTGPARRVPCLKRPARLMARPERARYWGVLQDARRAEPALQRTDRTTAGRPPVRRAALQRRIGDARRIIHPTPFRRAVMNLWTILAWVGRIGFGAFFVKSGVS